MRTDRGSKSENPLYDQSPADLRLERPVGGQAKIEILFCSKLAPAMQETCEQSFIDERKDALEIWKTKTKAKSDMVKPFIAQCSASCPD